MKNIPTVSVCMITYNHEQYIKEAIEGVLSQIVDFEIELILADDRSPDNTKTIVDDLIQNHPNGHWIKYTRHSENIGMMTNFTWALQKCNGKYIAYCEGDDYWTDPLKLQKQVDFLEANEGYSATAHDVRIIDEVESGRINLFCNEDITDLQKAYSVYLPTCSLVFRSFNGQNVMPDFNKYPMLGGDHVLLIGLVSLGKIKNFKEKMAVYRINQGGISINVNSKKKMLGSIPFNEFILSKVEYRNIWKSARKSLFINQGNLAILNLKERKFRKSLFYLMHAITNIRSVSDFKIFIKDILLFF